MIEAAATSGRAEVLGLLDQWGSIGSDKERWLNISRLYNAAKKGDTATVRQLVDDGIPPDKRNVLGVTPLWRASENGHKQVVEVLLATSAVDVNVRSTAGQTPLFWAAANGHSEVLDVRNRTDHNGRGRAQWAIVPEDVRESAFETSSLNGWPRLRASLSSC